MGLGEIPHLCVWVFILEGIAVVNCSNHNYNFHWHLNSECMTTIIEFLLSGQSCFINLNIITQVTQLSLRIFLNQSTKKLNCNYNRWSLYTSSLVCELLTKEYKNGLTCSRQVYSIWSAYFQKGLCAHVDPFLMKIRFITMITL